MGDSEITVGELKEKVESFIKKRNWSQFHDSKSLSMSIAIEVAELMENFQWVSTLNSEEIMQDQKLKANVIDEIADVLIYSLAFCIKNNIDVSKSINLKLKKNEVKYPISRFKGKYK